MLDSFDGDKRRHPRVDVRFPLQYKELHGTAKSIKGTITKNLSEGGVRFHTDNFISLACRLVVEVRLPSASKPIRAISKVAWIKKLPMGENYEVGNQFLDMTKEDKVIVSDYVKEIVSTAI